MSHPFPDFTPLRNIKKAAVVLLAMQRLDHPTGETELAQLLGYHPETIRHYLRTLLQNGLVARIARYRGYNLTENGHNTLYPRGKTSLTPPLSADHPPKASAKKPSSNNSPKKPRSHTKTSAEKSTPSAGSTPTPNGNAEKSPTPIPKPKKPRSKSSASAEKSTPSAENAETSAEFPEIPLNSINSNNNDLKEYAEKQNLNLQTLKKLSFWNTPRTRMIANLPHISPDLIEQHVHYLLHGEGKTSKDLPLVLYRLENAIPVPDCPCPTCDPWIPEPLEVSPERVPETVPVSDLPEQGSKSASVIEWDESEGGMHPQQAWEFARGELQYDLPKATFETWVSPTRLASYRDGTFTIASVNAFARDWLDQRLKSSITHLLQGIMNRSVEVQFGVGGQGSSF